MWCEHNKGSIESRLSGSTYNKESEMLLTRVILVVLRSATAMVLLIGLNPCGLPIRCSLRGGNVAYFSHGCELHAFGSVLSFSSLHIVGDANIDQLVTLIALILVCVSFL